MGLNVKFSQVTQGTSKGHLFNKHFAGYIKGAFPWGRERYWVKMWSFGRTQCMVDSMPLVEPEQSIYDVEGWTCALTCDGALYCIFWCNNPHLSL